MFEKEAEKWTIDYVCKDCSRYKECKSKEHCTCKNCSKEKWQNGAEFGYNKANEWHYPSKGEYPKEGENVLCYCKCRTEIKFYSIGHTIIGGDNKIRWWSSDRSEKLNVYAWKELTPPKEVTENEN